LFLAVMIGAVTAKLLAEAHGALEAMQAETNMEGQLAAANKPGQDSVDWNKKINDQRGDQIPRRQAAGRKEIDVILTGRGHGEGQRPGEEDGQTAEDRPHRQLQRAADRDEPVGRPNSFCVPAAAQKMPASRVMACH
jgi:hypothetical protein